MSVYEVKAGRRFWSTLDSLRHKYPREQFASIARTVKACICELQETGHVEEYGWNEHLLIKNPFASGTHFEFHIHDDDVLVVYCKRERNHVIRMVGVFDHESIPRDKSALLYQHRE